MSIAPDPGHRPEVRIGDREREQTVGHLGAAFSEGRLDVAEYDERVTAAYAAKTAGDLLPLTADLPHPPAVRAHGADVQRPAESKPPAHSKPVRRSAGTLERGTPTWVRRLWAVYFTAVAINLVIWFLVGIGSGDFPYFWPMWVAGPWGVVLLFQTFGTKLAGLGR